MLTPRWGELWCGQLSILCIKQKTCHPYGLKVKKLEEAGDRPATDLSWLPIRCYFHGLLIWANSDDCKHLRLLFTVVTAQLFVICFLKLFLTLEFSHYVCKNKPFSRTWNKPSKIELQLIVLETTLYFKLYSLTYFKITLKSLRWLITHLDTMDLESVEK